MSHELQGLCTGHDDPDLWFTDVPESIRDTGRLTIKEKQDTVAKAIVALSICNKCDVKAAAVLCRESVSYWQVSQQIGKIESNG